MNRFLSRREKDGSSHRRDKSRDKIAEKEKKDEKKIRPLSGDGILSLFKTDKNESQEPLKGPDTTRSTKMQTIRERIALLGYPEIEDQQINYAMDSQHARGDVEKAVELLILFQESVEGVIKPYKPEIHMLGAENREFVTCYLDSLLFAMFARLGSFEPILCNNFEDEPRRRLSTLLRLWVNLLRDGKLIRTDLTRHIQEALAACGWQDAARIEQQDVSEAFCFLTEKLELPLLTLKVDIYHTGGADRDDHRFVEERLLNVGVPDEVSTSRPIRLEDCLESYFNNRIEVKRHLERTHTTSSVRSGESSDEKESSQHIEVTVRDLPWTSIDTPTSTSTPNTPISPGSPRGRAISIVRRVEGEDGRHGATPELDTNSPGDSGRKTSMGHRKEILMPAWQFFNLIPWYTKSTQTNGDNAGITAHLSQTSPVLGICLKRYGMTPEGRPYRKNTFIDIPLDIRLPHFIDDETIPEEGSQIGNFKLSLQSVICHRGTSVNAGHYIAFIRGTTPIVDGDSRSTRRLSNASHPPHYSEERWIKFDDLSETRVSYVDVEKAMKDEMPYLLFYQVQSTDQNGMTAFDGQASEPPSYNDSAVSMELIQSTPELVPEVENKNQHGYFDGARGSSAPTIRLSTEIERPPTPRRSINLPEDRRGSLAFTETSLPSTTSSSIQAVSAPVTPSEETAAQRMSRAASRFTKSGNKSRPTSQSGESRISATFSRLNLMRSKDNLNRVYTPPKDTSDHTGGPAESRRSITIEEPTPRPSEQLKSLDFGLDRSKSKREKKREKSKERSEKSDKSDKSDSDHHHHHHHSLSHKDKGKGKEKGDNDRECAIM